MSIALLIIKILLAIPSLIELIHEIMDIIHRQPAAAHGELYSDFGHILRKHLESGCHAEACKNDLENFREHLIRKYA